MRDKHIPRPRVRMGLVLDFANMRALTDNQIFAVYDLGGWRKGLNRDVWGRFVNVTLKSPAHP